MLRTSYKSCSTPGTIQVSKKHGYEKGVCTETLMKTDFLKPLLLGRNKLEDVARGVFSKVFEELVADVFALFKNHLTLLHGTANHVAFLLRESSLSHMFDKSSLELVHCLFSASDAVVVNDLQLFFLGILVALKYVRFHILIY